VLDRDEKKALATESKSKKDAAFGLARLSDAPTDSDVEESRIGGGGDFAAGFACGAILVRTNLSFGFGQLSERTLLCGTSF